MKFLLRVLAALVLIGALVAVATTTATAFDPTARYAIYQYDGTKYVEVDTSNDKGAAIAEAQADAAACGCSTYVVDRVGGVPVYRSAHTHWTVFNQNGTIYAQGDAPDQFSAQQAAFFPYFQCNTFQRCTETFVAFP